LIGVRERLLERWRERRIQRVIDLLGIGGLWGERVDTLEVGGGFGLFAIGGFLPIPFRVCRTNLDIEHVSRTIPKGYDISRPRNATLPFSNSAARSKRALVSGGSFCQQAAMSLLNSVCVLPLNSALA